MQVMRIRQLVELFEKDSWCALRRRSSPVSFGVRATTTGEVFVGATL
ncbi:hypothetical protein E143388_07521 [Rhodococcus opacus]|nr:hypothetical protein E143388_07521 [Rhodococcus opacus]